MNVFDRGVVASSGDRMRVPKSARLTTSSAGTNEGPRAPMNLVAAAMPERTCDARISAVKLSPGPAKLHFNAKFMHLLNKHADVVTD